MKNKATFQTIFPASGKWFSAATVNHFVGIDKKGNEMCNIKRFESMQIRSVLNETDSRWYFSVAAVVEALTDSANVRDYIKKMRKREPDLNVNWGTFCPPLSFWLRVMKPLQIATI